MGGAYHAGLTRGDAFGGDGSMRDLVAISGAALLLVAACGGSGAPAPAASSAAPAAVSTATAAPARAKLVVSYSNVLADFFPAYVAKEAGIFDRNFLDVDLQLIASTTGLPALLAGQTQIAHIGGSEALTTTAGGAEVVVVANTGPVWPYQLYGAAEIRTAADLKGKKVAIAGVGGTFDIGIRTMLPKLGLAPDTDVTVLSTGSTANATAALLSGGVSATLSSPPDTLKLEAAGFHSVAHMADLNLPTAATTIVVTRSYLSANRAVVQRYVDSIVQAIARARADKAGTVTTLKKYLKSEDDKAMQAAYDWYVGTVLKDPPTPTTAQLAGIQEVVSRFNEKVKTVDLARLVDDSLVKSALDRGLLK
jgi:NitT/TauT family transport system substrate-binding protein